MKRVLTFRIDAQLFTPEPLSADCLRKAASASLFLSPSYVPSQGDAFATSHSRTPERGIQGSLHLAPASPALQPHPLLAHLFKNIYIS